MKDRNPSNPFYNSKSWKIFGLTKQDLIKYFFGGNAALAVLIISGIIMFLVFNATSFFPQYQKKLTLYRLSGQEMTDLYSAQYNKVVELESLCTQAVAYEKQTRIGALYRVTDIYSEFKSKALKSAVAERKELARSQNSLNNLKSKAEADTSITPQQIAQAEAHLAKTQKELKHKVNQSLNDLDYGHLKNKAWETSDFYLKDIRLAVLENITTKNQPQFIKNITAEYDQKAAKIDALHFIKELNKAKTAFSQPLPAYNTFINELRTIASTNKAQGEKFNRSADTIIANTKAKELAHTEEERNKQDIQIQRQLTVAPNYAKLCEPLYYSIADQKIHHEALKTAVTNGISNIPDTSEFKSNISRGLLEDIAKINSEILPFLNEKRTQIENWKHHKEYSMSKTIAGFFFGTEWVTNSSWQDFYGVVPLITGSVFVAIVAICIAVPFSVGGAIYVNRLSSKAEQTFIKPFIEFIQAIPSIVLAFFGYIVLGALIQKYSQSWMFSWLPGFPVEDQYTILNAGLLLALMAVPTIFTLCEDALNNVPKSYKEASLALGATNLQTVTKVILPSCASGVIAAILLGFGRIVGETMVVLLVLGGRIAIPGSWTDPAHSMTGILAQEIGEVNEGSLHWGALFMVGLVLFSIALGINYISQKILLKYTR